MIVEALVEALAALVAGIGSLFGNLPTPGWFASIEGALSSMAGYASGFGQWVPMGDAVTAATFVVACVGAGLVIRLVRIVASFLTAGGGSAG